MEYWVVSWKWEIEMILKRSLLQLKSLSVDLREEPYIG